MTDETCILIRCSQPILPGEGIVRLGSGGAIHIECMFAWKREGGALRATACKEEERDDD